MHALLAGPGPLLLDGGLATALEAKGFDLDDPLWSARLLIEAPDAVREVHTDFLEAGADVIATVTYQASLPGFAARGIRREEGIELFALAARLAVEARDAFWAGELDHAAKLGGPDQRGAGRRRPDRRRPLVAASVGPYGAYLADGSEYRGDYGVGRKELYDFHRERWHLFAASDADLIACETIPSALEAEVLLDLLGETPDTAAWISFSCPDGEHISDGTRIAEVAARCDGTPNLLALAVNCTKPRYIASLIAEIRSGSEIPILVYPNAGEEYDIATRSWVEVGEEGRGGAAMPELARMWVRAGASGVGGCCRVRPSDIRTIDAQRRADR